MIEAQPFFTSDPAGWLKVLGVLLAPTGLVLAYLVRLSTSRIVDDQKDLKRDINGLGERVGRVEESQTEYEATQTEHVRVIERHSLEIGAIRETTGEIRQALAGIEKLIRDSSERTQKDVHGLSLEVAGLKERDRIADVIETLLRGRND